MEADLASATAAEAMMTTSAEAVDSKATVKAARTSAVSVADSRATARAAEILKERTSEERVSAESAADSRATARAAEISSAEESVISPTTTRIKKEQVKTSCSEIRCHVPTI